MIKREQRVPVRLKTYFGGLNPGEVAGFLPAIAARLVDSGSAEYVTAEATAPVRLRPAYEPAEVPAVTGPAEMTNGTAEPVPTPKRKPVWQLWRK